MRGAGAHADALAVRVAQFRHAPSLDGYQAMHDVAAPLGRWAELREQALAQLLAGVECDGVHDRRSAPWAPRDRSLLVEIFLSEDDLTAAWEHAQAGGCSTALWRRLALARGRDRPDDALAVYRLLVDRTVAQTNDRAYREAVALLDELGELLARCGRQADHERLLTDVRAVHRRKRNLIKLLDNNPARG
jgi:uncharacterized Zn finger protein